MRRFLTLILCASWLVASAQVPDYVPTDSLVAWCPLDGDIANAAGLGLDGLSFTGEYISNRFGSEQSAAGLPASQLLELPINGALLTNAFTVCFWSLRRGNLGHNPVQIGTPGGGVASKFWLHPPNQWGRPLFDGNDVSGGVWRLWGQHVNTDAFERVGAHRLRRQWRLIGTVFERS